MKRVWLSPVVLIALACGGDSSAPQSAPPATPAAPAAAEPAPAPSPAPAPTPAQGGAPGGSLRGDAAAGAQLYATYCASCHGPEGKGDGAIAATLNPKPANHTDHVYMGSLSDQHLYDVISKGGAAIGKSPLMAPWGGVVNDEGIRDLIAFIRKLSST